MRLLHAAMELLFPRKCVLCQSVLSKDETDLCRRCRVEAPLFEARREGPRYTEKLIALWFYEDDVRASLIRYKFYNRRSYADVYGRMLAMKLLSAEADVLTWVPVSDRRRRKRGYDQVELIARVTARELGMDCRKLLCKHRDNKPQSSIADASQRRANVLGVYRMAENETVKDKRIVLLDDIVTTGATASECARVLLSAGAKEVICAAVAAGRKQSK